MQLTFENAQSGSHNLKLSGEFDAQGCREIREELETIVEKYGEHIIAMDMKDVSFIDSSGVGAIVFLFKRIVTMGGSLTIANVHGQPLELLTLLRVNEAIKVQALNASSSNPNVAA